MTPLRRIVLRSLTCIAAAILIATAARGAFADNPTAAENRKSGSSSWVLEDAGDPADCLPSACASSPGARRAIEGYASQTSYVAGDTLRIFVSCDDTAYRVRLYRVGLVWRGRRPAPVRANPARRVAATRPGSGSCDRAHRLRVD